MTSPEADRDSDAGASGNSQRLDKWLWFARVAKSRTLAAASISAGKVRVNRIKAEKPSHAVKPGDVVTSSIKKSVRVLRVVAAGERRGPATEAATLYVDLTPKVERSLPGASIKVGPLSGARAPGAGRPTKRDRRSIDRFTGE